MGHRGPPESHEESAPLREGSWRGSGANESVGLSESLEDRGMQTTPPPLRGPCFELEKFMTLRHPMPYQVKLSASSQLIYDREPTGEGALWRGDLPSDGQATPRNQNSLRTFKTSSISRAGRRIPNVASPQRCAPSGRRPPDEHRALSRRPS